MFHVISGLRELLKRTNTNLYRYQIPPSVEGICRRGGCKVVFNNTQFSREYISNLHNSMLFRFKNPSREDFFYVPLKVNSKSKLHFHYVSTIMSVERAYISLFGGDTRCRLLALSTVHSAPNELICAVPLVIACCLYVCTEVVSCAVEWRIAGHVRQFGRVTQLASIQERLASHVLYVLSNSYCHKFTACERMLFALCESETESVRVRERELERADDLLHSLLPVACFVYFHLLQHLHLLVYL